MEKNNQKSPKDIRDKIVSLLKTRGPSLPVHISREIELEPLFASAFLAELTSEKVIKISNMKVGGSPLYLIGGQEEKLDNFAHYLPGKEREAYALLKRKRILQDNQQEPAIRVALRQIKDFAFPFTFNTKKEKLLFWRFHNTAEQEIREMFSKKKSILKLPKSTKAETSIQPHPQIRPPIPTQPTPNQVKVQTAEKSLLTLKDKPKKEKSDFVKNIISILINENIKILEEIEVKKREYQAVISINSDLGKIKFLLIAKDKKNITDNDLTLSFHKSQALKMPLLIISPGELNNKAGKYLESLPGLIKFKKI